MDLETASAMAAALKPRGPGAEIPRVFTRSTWTAVGVLVTLAALQVGRGLPRPLDPEATASTLAGLAWAIVGFAALAELRRRRLGGRRAADRAVPEAPESLQRKLEYLANLSHEIRTPITSILGYTDVLCTEDVAPEEQLAHLETIRRNGDHLLAVVRDVLDLSRLEAGRVEVARMETDVPTLVLDVADMMRAEAVEKGIALEVRARGPVPATIVTDPTRLKQILINLVANAVKFTDDGSVTLLVGADRTADRLVVDVVDQGPGLSETERTTVFEPWTQGEAALGVPGGSGLGLAVARGLAALLGGEVAVTGGASGAGSVFTLALPLGAGRADLLEADEAFARLPRAAPRAAGDLHLRGRVLLVDDGADTRQLLAHFLRHAGCDVGTAIDGRDGVEALVAAEAAGRPFDLVLMDMEMPVLDGWETTRRLRARGVTVPIVALTAFGGTDRLAACLAAGCTEVLQKPATRSEVLAIVARHLPADPAASTEAPVVTGVLAELPQVGTLMRMFVTVLEQRMAEMEDALATGEAERLGRLAHRLRGAAGSYGFVAISDAAAMLESAAAQGRDVRACLDRLAHMCRQARAAVRDDGRRGSA